MTEPGGSALADVNLAVVNAANFTFAFTTTDAAGNYVVLTGLPAGQYLVKTLNQAGYVDELHSDVPCVTSSCSTASATPVSVVVGSSTTVNFVLDPGAASRAWCATRPEFPFPACAWISTTRPERSSRGPRRTAAAPTSTDAA